jgi:1-acyl-sn-glycerol-3-phosphate acyltransferase
MFPEGTRSVDGVIRSTHKGLGYLARTTKTKVLPLAIIGSDKKRGPIIVKIGKPIEKIDDPQEITDSWIAAITELTGFVYAGAPDLEEESEEKDISLQEA